MELAALGGNTPWEWHYKWMLGLPGRDEQIENYQRTICNLGPPASRSTLITSTSSVFTTPLRTQ
jgi:hypothetical protein